jgi:FtsH-binding integral membrane protein
MSWNEPSIVANEAQVARISAFLGKVYGWMFLGLLITTATAFVVANSPFLIETLILNRILFWGLVFGQLGLVWWMSAKVETMSPTTAAVLFLIYSGTVGITTSVILLVYTLQSVASTFMVTAGMFGALALFGTFTKRSLAGVGQFMYMGLIGLILAMVVNLFWANDALSFVISVIGVLVFTGLTAWDAQNLKHMAVALPDGRVGSYAVVGALTLYLDFINLFFFLLRLLGGRRT